jgi:hypothetical protein
VALQARDAFAIEKSAQVPAVPLLLLNEELEGRDEVGIGFRKRRLRGAPPQPGSIRSFS